VFQHLGVKTIVGEGVNRLDVFPKRKSGRGVTVLAGGEESGANLAGAQFSSRVAWSLFQLLPDRSTNPSEFSALV
jgi:hypothetical protein